MRGKLGLDNKKMLLAVPLCLAVIIYIDIMSIVRLQLEALKKLNPKIITLRKELDALDKGSIIMRDLKNKKKETLTKSKKIISEQDIGYILQDISVIAKNDDVKITQMRPLKESTGGKQEKGAAMTGFIPLAINLDLLCDYHHLGKFINDLENAEILFGVEGIRITSQEGNYFQQKVNLILKTYVKK
jgi:high-affinity Fe2+/Pb2+ permease